MGSRQKAIDKDLNKSANDFEVYVKPHVLRLLKGKIETVEGVTDDWMTETFSSLSIFISTLMSISLT